VQTVLFLDINECEEGGSNCHKYADCQNTMGGFECSCQPGYYGDGYTCERKFVVPIVL